MHALDKPFTSDFFCRPTLAVARDLLGTILCRRLPDGSVLSGPIVETEAYTADDPACHAFRGLTPRTEVMFGAGGMAYVYFIYGMYHCLNVVTERAGTPGAVLIRGVGNKKTNGPGKLCREWQINAAQNGANLMDPASDLWISQGEPLKPDQVGVSQRIGLSCATDLPWRFYIQGHPGVSSGKPGHRITKKRRQSSRND